MFSYFGQEACRILAQAGIRPALKGEVLTTGLPYSFPMMVYYIIKSDTAFQTEIRKEVCCALAKI